QHRARPMLLAVKVLLVENRYWYSKAARIASNFVERDETIEDVECRVFRPFSHDRTANLLELHDELDDFLSVFRLELVDVAQQQCILNEGENRLGGTRIS